MSRPISELAVFQLGFVAAELHEAARSRRKDQGSSSEEARVTVECAKALAAVTVGECLMKQVAALHQKWAAQFGADGVSQGAGLAYSTAAELLAEALKPRRTGG